MQQNELELWSNLEATDLTISHSPSISIGEVFTPLQWAKWLLRRYSIVEAWLSGKTVADPTSGEGVFIIALLELAIETKQHFTPSDIQRLFVIERKESYITNFRKKFAGQFNIEFPYENSINCDVIINPPARRFDILIGNPPWVNFSDLPDDYKEILKPYFISYELVPDLKQVLLGSSRVDISALVLKVAFRDLLAPNGFCAFFLPVSLFSGDDAHRGFRSYQVGGHHYSVQEIWEFKGVKIFANIATGYCVAAFKSGIEQQFPIKYYRGNGELWTELHAHYLRTKSDPLVVSEPNASVDTPKFSFSLTVDAKQTPRQGVNTCGANDLFIFNQKPDFLPAEFCYPLITKEFIRGKTQMPSKWILLPYSSTTGRIAERSELMKHTALWEYLDANRTALESRKGTMLRCQIRKGYFWAMLGVGPYCFAPFKVIWESYGSSQFSPRVVSTFGNMHWQANQAMHAFIPCYSEEEAEGICAKLAAKEFQTILEQMNGGGKCNWAQPGKIKKLINIRPARNSCDDNIETLELID